MVIEFANVEKGSQAITCFWTRGASSHGRSGPVLKLT